MTDTLQTFLNFKSHELRSKLRIVRKMYPHYYKKKKRKSLGRSNLGGVLFSDLVANDASKRFLRKKPILR